MIIRVSSQAGLHSGTLLKKRKERREGGREEG
jgi:hypothetical protein